MTVTTSPPSGSERCRCDTYTEAVQRLYSAECALHDAHATGVESWIGAASDRLHEALLEEDRLRPRGAPTALTASVSAARPRR